MGYFSENILSAFRVPLGLDFSPFTTDCFLCISIHRFRMHLLCSHLFRCYRRGFNRVRINEKCTILELGSREAVCVLSDIRHLNLRVRSRLHPCRVLQVNFHFSAFIEIDKMPFFCIAPTS